MDQPRNWMTSLLVVVLVAFVMLLVVTTRADNAELHDDLDEYQGDIAALAAELEARGGDPEEVLERAIPGPPGPIGPEGPRGDRGRDGIDGRDGRDGLTPACYFDGTGCVGPRGPAGADGRDGADSTVPGPEGPAGPAGADSTVPGPQGPPGPACPEGYEQAVIDSGPNQGWLACRPVAPAP